MTTEYVMTKKKFNKYNATTEDVKSDRPGRVDIAMYRRNAEPNGAGPLRGLQEHSQTEF